MIKKITTLFRSLLYLFLIIFLILVANYLYIDSQVNQLIFNTHEKIPPRKIGLILGTSPSRPPKYINQFYDNRMNAALDLYHKKKIKKIIVSGDNGTNWYDETSSMRKYLLEKKVPRKHIICDYAGFRTLDSVVRANQVFAVQNFIIISQYFHTIRALYIAKHHKIQAIGFAAQNPNHLSRFMILWRELFARAKMMIDLYVLDTKPKYPGPPRPITD